MDDKKKDYTNDYQGEAGRDKLAKGFNKAGELPAGVKKAGRMLGSAWQGLARTLIPSSSAKDKKESGY